MTNEEHEQIERDGAEILAILERGGPLPEDFVERYRAFTAKCIGPESEIRRWLASGARYDEDGYPVVPERPA